MCRKVGNNALFLGRNGYTGEMNGDRMAQNITCKIVMDVVEGKKFGAWEVMNVVLRRECVLGRGRTDVV